MKRPKILIFSTISPLPGNRGDRIRLLQISKNLSEVADVRLIYINRKWENNYHDELDSLDKIDAYSVDVSKKEALYFSVKALCCLTPFIVHRFITKKVSSFVIKHVDEFKPDIFWGYQIDSYPLFKYAKNAKKVIDIVDSLSFQYEIIQKQATTSIKTAILNRLQINLKHTEISALKNSDAVLVCSQQNSSHFQANFGNIKKLSILYGHVSDSFFDYRWQFKLERGVRLLFVGFLSYKPNELAVRYVIEKILPLFQERAIDVDFIVCGGGASSLQKEFSTLNNVKFKGYVDDLISEYLNSSVLVTPVPYASGIQTKLMEAMAIGLPVVMSRNTVDANEVCEGRDVLVCESPEDFLNSIIDVSTNEILAQRISQSARNFVHGKHSSSNQLEFIKEFLHSF
jgi:glycosyltransferase involved in cell wall biosynthesis